MFVPPLYPATDLIHGPDLERENKCLCGHMVRIADVDLCWTHRAGDDTYQWWCVCGTTCYTHRITHGDVQ